MFFSLLAFFFFAPPQAAASDTLTSQSFRAWLEAGHAFAANARLVHVSFQQQRATFPPWVPEDVIAQEEEAVQKVDFVEPALPFYAACFTDSEIRLATKMTLSTTGQQLAHIAAQTHLQAVLNGAAAQDAQIAGEDAEHQQAASVSDQEKQKIGASLTPEERVLVAKFTSAKVASLRQCVDAAYAKTVVVMKAQQEKAIQVVVEANQSRLQAAQTRWEEEHPAGIGK